MFSVMIVFVVSLLICCAIAYIMGQLWFSDVRNRGLRSFFVLGIEIFFWTLLNATAMVVAPEYFPVIYTLRMVLVCIIPFGVTWFILNFTESSLRKKAWMRDLLVILPAIDIFCMVTNPLHFYYFTDYNFPMPGRELIFWIHLVMDFLFVIIAFIILIAYIVKEARKNPILVLTGIGLLIPYIINILYTFGMIPFPHDITPIGFFVTFMLFVFVAYRSRLFKIKTTADLLNASAELEAALKEANSASKAKGDFLSNMSHEMRTPMNAIIGMTAIGKRADSIEEKNNALNKIGDAASHLLGVINDVLDMSKIEADKLELVSVEYNFEKMMQKVAAVINYRVDEKRQHFSINIDNAAPRFIVGDDQRLAQVMTNLLSNAVKFTPEGGNIHVAVDLIGETDGICELKVEVADNGIGISAEQMTKLFSAFVQADSGTSREYGGAGLGLVISKRIVELMGGRIWAESELGKGSRFIFTYFARRGENARAQLHPDTNWKNIRIMAVDSLGDTRKQFRELFEHLEIRCDVAADGFEACGLIEERGAYDIYFIGWRMPGMDGVELARRIKAQNGDRPSVVIVITAVDWEQIKDEASQAGVDKYLFKPIFSSSIIDCINECMGVKDRDNDRAEAHGEFEGKTMLLAEDIEINREILTALLDDTGLAIDCVENGKEALAMLEAAPDKYSIVFMDIQMPEMDGLEATRRIRALPAMRDFRLPIIAMTANVFKDDIESCAEAGMDDHLGKPLDVERVLAILRKYLKD